MGAGRLRDGQIEASAGALIALGKGGDDPEAHRIAQGMQNPGELDLVSRWMSDRVCRPGGGQMH
jgi:hypothetical protein